MALSRAPRSALPLSHLLLAGHNPLSPPSSYSSPPDQRQLASNPSLAPLPFRTWLSQVGREHDIPTRLAPAAGAGHHLHLYRDYSGTDRVFALGRNEAGQLGIGFASQEGTRGLVEGFEGAEVLQVAASVQASYLLVRTGEASTALYAFGNLARGRLGHPSLFPPSALEPHEEPRQHSLPRAVEVKMPEGAGRIKQIAAGFEHLLVLTEDGSIYGTGCNTDGQLGLGSSPSSSSSSSGNEAEGLHDIFQLTRLPLPAHIQAHEGGVKSISAGADTSALVTESGSVWTWGNSEYAQALHGRAIDQVPAPLEIDHSFLLSPSRQIIDYRCGGSFSLVLDDRSTVYSAGFGALGLGKAAGLQAVKPRVIEALEGEGVSRIRAGWGYAAAVRDAGTDSALWTWGLNNRHGRLGVGTLSPSSPSCSSSSSYSSSAPSPPPSSRFSPSARAEVLPSVPMHVYEPTRVALPVGRLGLEEEGGWRLGGVELGEDAMWVVVEVGVEG
ncbi:hypothetical protein JCM8097_007963 [Rhodosporidiobolus ruineniae]